MAEKEEEKAAVFFIPDNYTNSGGLFGGMLRLRNVIEALIVGGIIGGSEYLLIDIDLLYKIMIIVFTAVPLTIVSLIGIKGDSFSQFLLAVFIFLKDKRKMRYRRIKKNEPNAKTKGSKRL